MPDTEDVDMTRCEAFKTKALQTDRMTRYLFYHMDKKGCFVKDPWKFIQCVKCPTPEKLKANEDSSGRTTVGVQGGFLLPKEGRGASLAMCANNLTSEKQFNATVAHEMIHAYDFCTRDTDFSDCDHHACTEIRAASLSRDCLWSSEVRRGNFFIFGNHHFACVRRRAILSLQMNPHCKATAQQNVNNVWNECVKDLSPFGSIPF